MNKKDKAFKAELKRQRDEVVHNALDRLKCSVTKAVDKLDKLMDSSRDDISFAACRDIIRHVLKIIELENIEERLDKVERLVLERRSYR